MLLFSLGLLAPKRDSMLLSFQGLLFSKRDSMLRAFQGWLVYKRDSMLRAFQGLLFSKHDSLLLLFQGLLVSKREALLLPFQSLLGSIFPGFLFCRQDNGTYHQPLRFFLYTTSSRTRASHKWVQRVRLLSSIQVLLNWSRGRSCNSLPHNFSTTHQ